MVHLAAVGLVFLTHSLSVSLSFGEPICPIVGRKEALRRTNEIKAHFVEGINHTDRFNGPQQREGLI